MLRTVASSAEGLQGSDAASRLVEHGRNQLAPAARSSLLAATLRQLRSPLILILVFASGLSFATAEWIDATIVLAIVVASVGLSAYRENKADRSIALIRSKVQLRCSVLRDGARVSVPATELVPGDVVLLAAGSLVPADGRVLEASDCWVTEAPLTGESFAVAKSAALVAADAPLAERASMVFSGTNVRSGTARVVTTATGAGTEIGKVAHRLAAPAPETDFDRNIRRFGLVLTAAMLVLVLCVFSIHVVSGRPPVTTLLFAIALAVGLSPELLPAILAVNLTRGAEALSRGGVLVRRLAAIENLGAIDVLCTDKTGTLTRGVVEVEGAYRPDGAKSEEVLELAAWNAALETGVESRSMPRSSLLAP